MMNYKELWPERMELVLLTNGPGMMGLKELEKNSMLSGPLAQKDFVASFSVMLWVRRAGHYEFEHAWEPTKWIKIWSDKTVEEVTAAQESELEKQPKKQEPEAKDERKLEKKIAVGYEITANVRLLASYVERLSKLAKLEVRILQGMEQYGDVRRVGMKQDAKMLERMSAGRILEVMYDAQAHTGIVNSVKYIMPNLRSQATKKGATLEDVTKMRNTLPVPLEESALKFLTR